jgi:hypothetical protein
MMNGPRPDRSGLGRFDLTPTPIIRTPTRHPDGEVICPECGNSVGQNRGTHHIRQPDLADDDLRNQLDQPLLVHGWLCVRHQYDVVIPLECRGRDAADLPDGWVGIRLVFADEATRWVPTPRREIEEQEVSR